MMHEKSAPIINQPSESPNSNAYANSEEIALVDTPVIIKGSILESDSPVIQKSPNFNYTEMETTSGGNELDNAEIVFSGMIDNRAASDSQIIFLGESHSTFDVGALEHGAVISFEIFFQNAPVNENCPKHPSSLNGETLRENSLCEKVEGNAFDDSHHETHAEANKTNPPEEIEIISTNSCPEEMLLETKKQLEVDEVSGEVYKFKNPPCESKALLPSKSETPKKDLEANKSVMNDCRNKRLACFSCEEIFLRTKEYKAHMTRVHTERPFQCTTCGKFYGSRRCLRGHELRRHKDEQSFGCSHCDKTFSAKKEYMLHMRTHTGENSPINCKKLRGNSVCDEVEGNEFVGTQVKTSPGKAEIISTNSFPRETILEARKQLEADEVSGEVYKLKNPCKSKILLASKSKTPKKDVKTSKSVMNDSRQKRLACLSCDEFFSRPKAYKAHMTRVHTERPFQCKSCGKFYSSRTGLRLHELRHRNEKGLECSHCNKTFSINSEYIVHMRIHTGEKPFECTTCGKSFVHKGSLVIHQFKHSEEKPFKCVNCEKSFAIKNELIRHEQTHTGEKAFKCTTCGKRFTSKQYLKIHERNHTTEKIHSEEKPFKCTTCGRTFANQANFARHERAHTEEKPFKCQTCGESFRNKENLTLHQRNHAGEPFKCTTCGKLFVWKRKLTQHQRTHTAREKPFKCTTCGKNFGYKETLTRHQKIHNHT